MELPEDPMGDLWRVRPPSRLPWPRVVRPVPVDPRGIIGPTPGRARGPYWRRTSPRRYVPADAVGDQPAQRIIEAAGNLPAGGAVTGWASLHLARAPWFDGQDATGNPLPVPLALGTGYRPRTPGVCYDRRSLSADEVVVRCGVPTTCAHRAILDEMRRTGSLRLAVVTLDMAMHAELTSLRRFDSYLASLPRVPGLRLARRALRLAAEGAESPPEVELRLIWELGARRSRPLCNVDLFAPDGRFLARPDLFDPVAGVVGEYDGAHHLSAAARSRDLNREADLRDHGLEYVSVVGGEKHDLQMLRRRIHQAYARAERSVGPRRWTLDGPGPRPLTLDERMDLRSG